MPMQSASTMSLPAKGHWTGSQTGTPVYSNTFRFFNVQQGQWIFADDSNGTTPIQNELPENGLQSNWIPMSWIFVPAVNTTANVTMYFQPEPATWATDAVAAYVVSSTNVWTTVFPATQLNLIVTGQGTRSVMPSFASNTITMGFLAGEYYRFVYEFSVHFFKSNWKCKAHVAISGSTVNVSGTGTVVPQGPELIIPG